MSLRRETPCDYGMCPYGAENMSQCDFHCGEMFPEYRYTLMYDGVLFYGDKEKNNAHGYNNWEAVEEIMSAYPDVNFYVVDNYYDVRFSDNAWY